MVARGQFTEEQIADMARRYTSGETSTSIGRAYGVHRATVYDLLSVRGIAMRSPSQAKRVYALREDAFRAIDDEQTAYWFGFVCADGCVVQRRGGGELHVVLQARDIPHLEKYRAFLGTDAPIRIEANYETYRVSTYSARIASDLIALGCTSNKSLTFAFPTIPPHRVAHFVRGYFDGDGSAFMSRSAKGPVLSFVGTETFLTSLRNVINAATRAGGGLYCHTASRAHYLIYSGAFQVASIGTWMYADATVYLDRTWDIVRQLPPGKRRGYPTARRYVGTAGQVSSETIRRYMEAQKGV